MVPYGEIDLSPFKLWVIDTCFRHCIYVLDSTRARKKEKGFESRDENCSRGNKFPYHFFRACIIREDLRGLATAYHKVFIRVKLQTPIHTNYCLSNESAITSFVVRYATHGFVSIIKTPHFTIIMMNEYNLVEIFSPMEHVSPLHIKILMLRFVTMSIKYVRLWLFENRTIFSRKRCL